VHILRLHMCILDFRTEPPHCPDDESRDIAFVKASSSIRSRDAVEEYLACEMHQLSASVDFRGITDGVTPVLRVRQPLPKFHAKHKEDEDDIQFLVRVELEAESVVGKCVERRSTEPRIRAGGSLVWSRASAWH
jgi:hypothetical protein